LGLASARALAAEGCRVVLCARGAGPLKEAAAEVESVAAPGAAVLAVTADVSTADGAATVVGRTVETFGRLDVLVNNVGKAGGGDIVSTPDGGRARSIRRSFPRSGCRAWPCRRCVAPAAAPSS
jgi:NAD(P)-dependent dehydrogenase (short-subunit alcohol dehydrogenase family)